MKKLVFMFLSIALTTGAIAQTSPVKKAKVKVEKKELKKDIVEKRDDQKVVRKDVAKGKLKKAKIDHKEVKQDKAEVNADAAKLEKAGVTNPKAKARKEIRADKAAK